MRTKRKHGRRKATGKKPTVGNGNEEPMLNFGGQNALEDSGPDESNDDGFGESDPESDSSSLSTSSSSSTSSSGSDGSFNGQDTTSSSDESEINRRMKKLAKKRGRPKKDKALKKATHKKAKSSKGFGSSNRKEKQSKNQREDHQYNKGELKASFAVIKKVMEMDEAKPFSAPVDPVSLGMPDYFDVIDTPMDFGTICSNLRNGVKYLNSEDVYKDVQYIWENCCKVNKKGDYIVYLMKRVKKKFMKYWTAAGLHEEMRRKTSGHSDVALSKDHAKRRGRHEDISMVNHMLRNSSQMQQDNFGASQPPSEVPLSSYIQSYHLYQPQLSTNLPPQFPQSQACPDSNYAGPSRLPVLMDSTMKQKKHASTCPEASTVSGPAHSTQRQSQSSSYYLGQSQLSTCQPQPSESRAVADISNTGHPHVLTSIDCSRRHTGCVPGFTVDAMVASRSQLQPQQPPVGHGQPNESHQPQASVGLPQPSQPLASADVSNAGNSYLPLANVSKRVTRHAKRSSAGPGAEMPYVPSHSQPDYPLRNDNPPHQSQQPTHKEKKKVRGPTKCHDMWDMPEGERIFVPINMLGQPVGPEASKLSSFLGTIARDGKMAPLTFADWRSMPDSNKEDMWQFVQTKFDIDPICKTWILKSLGSKWRNWKAKLKADHYYPHKTDEERLKDRDRRVLPDQWPILVSYWNSEEMQLRCATNRANRANQKSTHAAGSKSFARIREEERGKRPDGKEPTRAELYILTRTRKNGQPVNGVAADVISKLREQTTQKQQTSRSSNDWEDSFFEVMGEEKGSQVRMYGLGPTPAELWGRKPGRVELMKMAFEAKQSATEEVSKVLDKMEVMEHKYAHMEAQMARMTSNMQNFLDKMGVALGADQVPNNLNAHEDSLQAQAHSSSSSRAVSSAG